MHWIPSSLFYTSCCLFVFPKPEILSICRSMWFIGNRKWDLHSVCNTIQTSPTESQWKFQGGWWWGQGKSLSRKVWSSIGISRGVEECKPINLWWGEYEHVLEPHIASWSISQQVQSHHWTNTMTLWDR